MVIIIKCRSTALHREARLRSPRCVAPDRQRAVWGGGSCNLYGLSTSTSLSSRMQYHAEGASERGPAVEGRGALRGLRWGTLRRQYEHLEQRVVQQPLRRLVAAHDAARLVRDVLDSALRRGRAGRPRLVACRQREQQRRLGRMLVVGADGAHLGA